MTDTDIIKALECCDKINGKGCYFCPLFNNDLCNVTLRNKALDLINRQKAEINDLSYKLQGVMHSVDKWLDGDELKQDEVNRATTMREKTLQIVEKQMTEIDNLDIYAKNLEISQNHLLNECATARKTAIKELSEKITEVFTRYAHLHSYAEGARKDFIETVDGTRIEMQSVWDVFALKKHEIAEYEEMSRLQKNIESIAEERLLTELEKDFRLLVKEMAGDTE